MKNNILKLFLAALLFVNITAFAQDPDEGTTIPGGNTNPNGGTSGDENIEDLGDPQGPINNMALWLGIGGVALGGLYLVNRKDNRII